MGDDGRFGNDLIAVDEGGDEAGRVHGEEVGRLVGEVYGHLLEGEAELGEGDVDAVGDCFIVSSGMLAGLE
ncbi:hypothetical protein GGTG_04890 [Gaeumannomyces tritici R3-111a-1]|uniref:Uncharacterized protein n=1 Tax=Gaeumannomyces tritici (strain R3-111a-1) TaxID=644352 RepID=J3NUD4_GAET3|nr:hypothetical protein GGTG_04890 [Gaeumannomyces tritici R3-111a-1]EJT79807.1 hypothetical protein GGTG_04890 [Gaeumannomyces tritici R3-111a-1]